MTNSLYSLLWVAMALAAINHHERLALICAFILLGLVFGNVRN